MKSLYQSILIRLTLIVTILTHLSPFAFGQYEKNPLMPITDDGFYMTVEKFVKIPDDTYGRPRINTFTYYGDKIFVASELDGKIYEIIKDGNTYKPVLFFNVKAGISAQTGRALDINAGWHDGLRSVAFHPEFSTNGKFYTSLMESRPANTTGHKYLSDPTNHINNDGVVVEWTYSSDTKNATYREIFRVGQPSGEHPIKEVKFNRYAQPGDEDYGLLYITHGDGTDPNNQAVKGTGQNNDAFGKVLRINPLQSGDEPYTIPPTNPFVNDNNWLDEIYSLGHRNPHTVCFGKDKSGNVHLIIGEVGLNNMEEINLIVAGGNYGWGEREGTYVRKENGLIKGIGPLPEDDSINPYIYPAAQFTQTGLTGSWFNGQAIAGGYVYTDPVTEKKIFLFADFAVAGRVFHADVDNLLSAVTTLDSDNPDRDNPRDLTQAHIGEINVLFDHDNNLNTQALAKTSMKDVIDDEASYDVVSDRADLRFGQDKDENIYIMSKRNGWVYKVQSISQPVVGPQAPVLAAMEGTTIRIIKGDAPANITGTTTVTDIDNANLSNATIQITENYVSAEDVLAFGNANGIIGSWTPATGILSLTGSATIAAYQTALRSITYQNTNDTNPSTLNRKVNFTVNDGSLNSNSVYRTIEVTVNTGLDKYENAQFSAYPNPISKDGILRLSFTKAPTQVVDIVAVNIEGRKWNLGKTISGDKNVEIDLREKNLPTGYFIIHINAGDTRVAYPVVIR